jgi:uncharacterized OB-fold protein
VSATTPALAAQRFWEACRRGALELAPCTQCSQLQFPPAAACRHCAGELGQPVELPGTGTIASYTVNHRAPHADFPLEVPYVLLLVDLDPPPSGDPHAGHPPRMMCNLLPRSTTAPAVEIGQRVRICFEPRDGLCLPQANRLDDPES